MEFLLQYPAIVWFLVGVAFFVIEDLTPGFFMVFFGVGAVATAILHLTTQVGWSAQLTCFIVASLASLVLLRRKVQAFFKGYAGKESLDDPLVRDRYVGRSVVVVKDVSREKYGLVELDGTNWQARTDGPTLPAGERVKVMEMDGLTLLVRRGE